MQVGVYGGGQTGARLIEPTTIGMSNGGVVGHRAEKNRLRHGFASGERPPHPGIHNASSTANKPRPVHRLVKDLTGWVAPKRGRLDKDSGKRTWAPRHMQTEKKFSGGAA